MIPDQVRREIEAAGDQDDIVLILRWSDGPDPQTIRALPTRAARAAFSERFFDDRKAPVLRRLGATPGLRITNPLTGSGNAVIAGPARVWRTLIAAGDSPLHGPDIEVTANKVDMYALRPTA